MPAHANNKEPSALLETQPAQPSPLFPPSCSTLPLLGIGFADPLSCHGADVVLGVKVSLLDLPPVYHEHHVIDCDAVAKKEEIKQLFIFASVTWNWVWPLFIPSQTESTI